MVTKKTVASNSSSLPSYKQKAKSHEPLHVRCGLNFPVSRIRRYMRNHVTSGRVATNAGVHLTAVLEYACAEVLTAAGEKARGDSRKRIKPEDVMGAFREDGELNQLLGPETEMYQGDIYAKLDRQKQLQA